MKIRRTILLLSVVAVLLASCGAGTDEEQDAQRPGAPATSPGVTAGVLPSSASGNSSPSGPVERRVAISAAVFDGIYRQQIGDRPSDAYGQVILNALICGIPWEASGHPESEGVMPAWSEDALCQEPLSAEEQASLLSALADLPEVMFTSEPDEVADRLLNGDLVGTGVLLSLGPIEGAGGRVEVPATAGCGLNCWRWTTFVVERRADGWEVTGTTGPSAMA